MWGSAELANPFTSVWHGSERHLIIAPSGLSLILALDLLAEDRAGRTTSDSLHTQALRSPDGMTAFAPKY